MGSPWHRGGSPWRHGGLHGAMEAHHGTVEAHHDTMEAHHGVVEAHHGAEEAHHGAMKAHRNRNLEKDHSSVSGSDYSKVIQLQFRFRLRLGNTAPTAQISIDFFSQIPLSQKITLSHVPLPQICPGASR
jgi:hypothetical protein